MEARVTLTYLMTLEPKDVGLEEDCMPQEFELATKKYVSNHFIIPNDIEIEVIEKGE